MCYVFVYVFSHGGMCVLHVYVCGVLHTYVQSHVYCTIYVCIYSEKSCHIFCVKIHIMGLNFIHEKSIIFYELIHVSNQ